MLTTLFAAFLTQLDARHAHLVFQLFLAGFFARGRRTVTSWFRAAGITLDFRRAYRAVYAVGRRARRLAGALLTTLILPLLRGQRRLVFALDDTPTERYGPEVEGAGKHHNPTPGPAGARFLYGHVWVTLAVLACHPAWGTIALPLLAALYVRAKDVPLLPSHYRWVFRTKLELAVELLTWLTPWLKSQGKPLWVVVDGGYAVASFLRPAQRQGWTVVSRLRRNAALCTVPQGQGKGRGKGRRGRPRKYGKGRIDLAAKALDARGWKQVSCLQYGERVAKTVKSFLATWRPAGGVIRVVLVEEERGWICFFCTDRTATVAEVLSLMADRNALEQSFKDVKEAWGAGKQQVRNLWVSVGALHLCLWCYTVTEVWAWDRRGEELVDRSQSPWDVGVEERRPSHADRRGALRRELLGNIIARLQSPGVELAEIRAIAMQLGVWAT